MLGQDRQGMSVLSTSRDWFCFPVRCSVIATPHLKLGMVVCVGGMCLSGTQDA